MQWGINSMRAFLNTVFLSIFFFLSTGYAEVEVVTKKIEGRGKTTNQAIEDALVNAVTALNGVSISANTVSAVMEASADINFLGKKKPIKADIDSHLKTVVKKTNGVIKNYDFISERKDGDLVVVTLNVTISKLSSQPESKRIRIALLPFKVNDKINPEYFEEFDPYFNQTLINNLTNTRKFGILDREYLDEQSQELDFIQNGGAGNDEMVKIGSRLGADYIITGTIVKLEYDQIERKSRVSDKTKITIKSSAELTFRLIDVATSIVKFAKTYNLNNNNSIENLAIGFSKMITDSIIETIYPIRILSSTSDGLIIGQGGDSISSGQKYSVYQLGKELIDPYTKESLGREEIKVGLFEVSDVKPKFSYGKIIEGNDDLMAGLSLYRYILRPFNYNITETSGQNLESNKESDHKKNREKLQNLKDDSESDW